MFKRNLYKNITFALLNNNRNANKWRYIWRDLAEIIKKWLNTAKYWRGYLVEFLFKGMVV